MKSSVPFPQTLRIPNIKDIFTYCMMLYEQLHDLQTSVPVLDAAMFFLHSSDVQNTKNEQEKEHPFVFCHSLSEVGRRGHSEGHFCTSCQW